MVTFKDVDNKNNIDKRLTKFGSSLGIVFTKDDLARFRLKYGDIIRLDNAEIIECDDKKYLNN